MNERLAHLYQRYLEETCTEDEREELLSILAEKPGDPQIADLLDGTWNNISMAELRSLNNPGHILNNILNQHSKPAVRKISWYRFAAAASIAIALSAVIYFYNSRNPVVDRHTDRITNIAPGTNKAILTLSNGKTIILDSAMEGEIARQAGIAIRKTGDGQLVYDIAGDQKNQNTSSLAYNTIVTPRGGQYQVNLPDGTKIWLNAASSLKYPAIFNGKQRRVELSGEAYFEVAKDKAHPFIVVTERQEVQVLGTHFNVNSYTDEGVTKTTLLEGSVEVSVSGTPNESQVLKPGQQALLRSHSLNVYTVDTEEAVAWKNGFFQFNEADLGSIMRQLSRWYNVDVTFESKPSPDLFHFKVPRNMSLTDLQKIFEINGINFKIEGRTLIVKS